MVYKSVDHGKMWSICLYNNIENLQANSMENQRKVPCVHVTAGKIAFFPFEAVKNGKLHPKCSSLHFTTCQNLGLEK